jgi:hypothetical protein
VKKPEPHPRTEPAKDAPEQKQNNPRDPREQQQR